MTWSIGGIIVAFLFIVRILNWDKNQSRSSEFNFDMEQATHNAQRLIGSYAYSRKLTAEERNAMKSIYGLDMEDTRVFLLEGKFDTIKLSNCYKKHYKTLLKQYSTINGIRVKLIPAIARFATDHNHASCAVVRGELYIIELNNYKLVRHDDMMQTIFDEKDQWKKISN